MGGDVSDLPEVIRDSHDDTYGRSQIRKLLGAAKLRLLFVYDICPRHAFVFFFLPGGTSLYFCSFGEET